MKAFDPVSNPPDPNKHFRCKNPIEMMSPINGVRMFIYESNCVNPPGNSYQYAAVAFEMNSVIMIKEFEAFGTIS